MFCSLQLFLVFSKFFISILYTSLVVVLMKHANDLVVCNDVLKVLVVIKLVFFLFYRELFSTVIDMLATLIHSTLVSDSQSEKGEENRKHYQNLMRKLKKVFFYFYSWTLIYIILYLSLCHQKQLWTLLMCDVESCTTFITIKSILVEFTKQQHNHHLAQSIQKNVFWNTKVQFILVSLC